MILKENDKVVIVATIPLKGEVGYISKVLYPFGDNGDPTYALKKSKNSDVQGEFKNKTFPGESLARVFESDVEYSGFDFSKYLSDGQIQEIAKKVCEEQMKDYMRVVFNNRDQAGISVCDQLLRHVAKEYTTQLADQYKDEMLVKIQEEINRTDDFNDPDKQTFGDSLKWELKKVAAKFIEDNPKMIQNQMVDTIMNQASLLSTDAVSNMIASRINVQQIIKDVVKENTKTEIRYY